MQVSRLPTARTLIVSIALVLGTGLMLPAGATPMPAKPDIAVNEQPVNRQAPQPPDVLFGALFEAVQQTQLYPDQKTFADAIPRQAPAEIMAAWQQQKTQPGFDLKAFTDSHFMLPAANKPYRPPAGQSLRQHIDGLWPVLTRTTDRAAVNDSLLALPHSYVVPGGRFREIYYWDSYFTMLGLAESGNWQMVENMTNNFAHEIDTYGHIPNGNRSYYLSRSQPPFFSFMVSLLASHQGDGAYARYRPQLEKEYQYWMQGAAGLANGQAAQRVVRLDDGSLLNRYWDDRDVPRTESWLQDLTTAKHARGRPAAEVYRDLRAGAASGWDFSSRWLRDPRDLTTIHTTDIVPVDLNALLWHLEDTLARAAKAEKAGGDARHYQQLADARSEAINQWLWNQVDGFYTDYDWRAKRITTPVTAATVFPLFVQIAPRERAIRTARTVRNLLLKEGGLSTSTINTGQQWDAPNGWAPLQWVAVEGFSHYGQDALAQSIGSRFLTNVQRLYAREQKLVEKYVVDGKGLGGGGGGEYALQDGFGWTNGVTLKLLDKYCAPLSPCATQQVSQSAPAVSGQ